MSTDRSIMAQTAYKCASWLHSAEAREGATVDTERLHELARTIANGMFKLSGSPSAGEGGAGVPRPRGAALQPASDAPAPPSFRSCPHCDERLCTPNERDNKFFSNKGKKKRGEISDKAPDYKCRRCGLVIWPDGRQVIEEVA